MSVTRHNTLQSLDRVERYLFDDCDRERVLRGPTCHAQTRDRFSRHA